MKILSFLFLLTFVQWGYCQKSTYLGAEISAAFDQYEVVDPCNIIGKAPLLSTGIGITVGQEVHKLFVLESGVIFKFYEEGYSQRSSFGNFSTSSQAFNALQIPIRLRARIPLVRERLFFTATVGYHLSWNTEYNYGGGFGSSASVEQSDTTRVFYRSNPTRKTFSLIETGIGLELRTFKHLIWSISGNYYAGLQNVYHMDFQTSNAKCTNSEAWARSNGSYWTFTFALRYAISSLWQKGEKQIDN